MSIETISGPAPRADAADTAVARWRYGAALAAAVILAAALRIWFWSWQAMSGAVQPGDPEEYYRAALHLLQGGYHDSGKWLRPPLYPAFLALLFAIGGVSVPFALLAQALLSALGVLPFAALARRLSGERTAGALAALLAALFVPFASFGSVLFAEALFVMLVMLGLVLLDRAVEHGGVGAALLAGAVFGLAALARAVALMFIPIAAGMLFFLVVRRSALPGVIKGISGRVAPPRPAPPADQSEGSGRVARPAPPTLQSRTAPPTDQSEGSGRVAPPRPAPPIVHRLVSVIALLLGAALVIGPWTLRNYLVHQRLIVVDTNGGISMWYGTVRSEQDRLAGEAAIFSLPNLADRQALAVRMTVERALADPAFFIGRMRFKIASLFLLQSRSYAVGDVVTIDPRDNQIALSAGENPRWLSLIADAQYVLIMLGGIAGFCFAPAPRRVVPALVWFAFGVLISAITVAHHRLRLPLIAVFIPTCAYALLGLPTILRRGRALLRDRRLYGMLAGWMVFVALIGSLRYVNWFQAEFSAVEGRTALAAGNRAEAEAALLHAYAQDSNNSLRAIELADLAFAAGDYARAASYYNEAAALEPRSLYAQVMRIQTATLRGIPAEAQTALAAIAESERDNNDLYAWAWEHARTPAPSRVVPGDPVALGHYAGFAPATFDLKQGRWTLGEGRVRVRGSCGVLLLQLRGPAGREVRISLPEWGLEQQIMLSGALDEVMLPLNSVPGCANGPALEVQISSVTSLLDLEQAPWMTGVAVVNVSER